MMFGTREAFEYLECAECGCLQIAEIPADLARHYPSDGYYSYKAPQRKEYPGWLLWLRRERTRARLGEFSLLGKLLSKISKDQEHFGWLRGRVTLDSKILDVGCGAGKLLLLLQREGFRNLFGADPFLEADIDHGGGLKILKRGIEQVEGKYDFIMLHHSFEHMPEPAKALGALAERLTRGGSLLLRIPVADCAARKIYGLDWMAWDAPRHLFLHTAKSIERLAAGAGLQVAGVVHDSTVQQFSSSELYRRGIPYTEHGKYRPGNRPDAFSQDEWDSYQRQADELNRKGEGDTACFYLRLAV